MDIPRTTLTTPKLGMMVVMGETGAGKSFFINRLAGTEVAKEGHSIYSCTQKCQPIPVQVGGTTILMLDTPGFDDSDRPESEILSEIATVLVAQHRLGVQLVGIIYIHRITAMRFKGSAGKTLNILQRICGPGAMKNVLLMTSGWSYSNSSSDNQAYAFRERELQGGPWSAMMRRGSKPARFYADQMSARMIICRVLANQPVVLEIQDEICNRGLQLRDTAAGSYLYDYLEEVKVKYEAALGAPPSGKGKHRKSNPQPSKKKKRSWEEDPLGSFQRTQSQQESLNVRIDEKVEDEMKRHRWAEEVLETFQSLAPFLGLVLQIMLALLGL